MRAISARRCLRRAGRELQCGPLCRYQESLDYLHAEVGCVRPKSHFQHLSIKQSHKMRIGGMEPGQIGPMAVLPTSRFFSETWNLA